MHTNKFTLSITLQQHTPLIHFQHDQAGATLRATEFRAAFNRFLVDDFRRIRPEVAGTYPKAYQQIITEPSGDGKTIIRAPYKLWIEAKDPEAYLVGAFISNPNKESLDNLKIKYLDNTSYFADAQGISNGLLSKDGQTSLFKQGDFSGVRKGLYFDKLTLRFWSLSPELLNLIEKALPYFLAFKNFGTRQSKGFGCFYLSPPNDFENIVKSHPEIVAVYRKSIKGDYKDALKTIQQDYQTLKSGIANRSKSLLANYFEKNGQVIWEKELIKKKLNGWDTSSSNGKPQYQYVRALLGLAEHNEFPSKGGNKNKRVVKIKDTKKDTQEEIQRMQSPIQFKVIDKYIYLIGWRLPNEIFKREFSFDLEESKDKKTHLFNLAVPSEFDLAKFLKHACGRETHVDNSLKHYILLK